MQVKKGPVVDMVVDPVLPLFLDMPCMAIWIHAERICNFLILLYCYLNFPHLFS